MKIKWRDAGYGFENGYIEEVRIFTIGYFQNSMYKLSCRLPGVKDQLVEDMSIGKKLAPKIILTYIKFLKGK